MYERELTLDELLNEPVIRKVMIADGYSAEDIRLLIRQAQRPIERRRLSPGFFSRLTNCPARTCTPSPNDVMPISAFGLAMPSDGVNWEQPYGSGSSHMAVSYHGSFGDRPRSGGGAVLAFLIVIGVTLVAFHVTAAGVFYEPPTVRIHAGSQLAAPPPNPHRPSADR